MPVEFLELLKTIQAVIPSDYAWVSQAISNVFPWLTLAIALFLCLFGYKVHRLWAAFLFCGMGILVGVITGAFLMITFPNLNGWVGLSPPLVLGVLGVVFSKRLHKLQLFLVNATLVYAALPGILSRYLPDTVAVLAGLACAIAVGILAAKYKYIVTIITTSVSGALTAVPMILALVKVDNLPFEITLKILLAAVGLLAQTLLHKHDAAHKKRSEEKVAQGEENKSEKVL